MEISCLPSEILCLIGGFLGPKDVLAFGSTCKTLAVVPGCSVRRLQQENVALCLLADKVDLSAANRIVFPFLAFAFCDAASSDRVVINRLNSFVERKARDRIGANARPKTLGNPCHWDRVRNPPSAGIKTVVCVDVVCFVDPDGTKG